MIHGSEDMKNLFSLSTRSCGLLLHLTSLPGPYGCGSLGQAARWFADFLVSAGQSWWQTLPLVATGSDHVPYNSISVFAGNPLLIDLDQLAQEDLLTQEELQPPRGILSDKVCYGMVQRFHNKCLGRAFKRYCRRQHPSEDLRLFCEKHRGWLDDFALFQALSRAYGTQDWTCWDPGIKRRKQAALNRAWQRFSQEIAFERFIQFQFAKQWGALKKYCNRRGVGLIGDMPLFVSHNSSDVWSHPELFQLDRNGASKWVSGVPPDSFSQTGQLWGHPLYHWKRHVASDFAWWMRRFKQANDQFDALRLDHFFGFYRCWAVRGNRKTAEHGKWVRSPGEQLFTKLKNEIDRLQIIAEDLGPVTHQALALRDRFGFSGMRLLQNGLSGSHFDLPHYYPSRCVAYTGTHDNDTVVGWFNKLSAKKRKDVLRYASTNGKQIHWDLVRLLYQSAADLVIIPTQDILGLGHEARMNRPATHRGNWRWRVSRKSLNETLARRLYQLAQTYDRTDTRNSCST